MKTITIEDLHVGRLFTVLACGMTVQTKHEYDCGDSSTTWIQYGQEFEGLPMRVRAIDSPYVAAEILTAGSRPVIIDSRMFILGSISPEYAAALTPPTEGMIDSLYRSAQLTQEFESNVAARAEQEEFEVQENKAKWPWGNFSSDTNGMN